MIIAPSIHILLIGNYKKQELSEKSYFTYFSDTLVNFSAKTVGKDGYFAIT